MTGNDFLKRLQAEAAKTNGFHPELRLWVDDASSVAKALKSFDKGTTDGKDL